MVEKRAAFDIEYPILCLWSVTFQMLMIESISDSAKHALDVLRSPEGRQGLKHDVVGMV